MTNENNNPTTTTRKCNFVKKSDGNVCNRRFRFEDETMTECYQHRTSLATPIQAERSLALLERKPEELTFKVNVGEVLIGQEEARLYVLIVSAVSQRIGLDLHVDAFVATSIGTKESAVTLPADAAQFLLMAFPTADTEVLVEIEGKVHKLRIAVADEDWAPAVLEETCGACWAAGRVCILHDQNRWVVKVAILAKENGIRHSEVEDADLRANAICPFHGKAANRLVMEAAQKAGKLKEGERLYVYGPYEGQHGEGVYLKGLQKRQSDSTRAEAEVAAAFVPDDLFKLGDIAAEQKRRKEGRSGSSGGFKNHPHKR